jgi:hypothetical protein
VRQIRDGVRFARLHLPRGVLTDVLRDRAGQPTPTGTTLPPGGSPVALLCHVIEHEALGMGMVVKGLKLGQPTVLVNFGLIGPTTPRWAGVVLLAAFVAALVYLVGTPRGQEVLRSHEVDEVREERQSPHC